MRTDDLLEYLEERLTGLPVERDTKAYIVGVFHSMKNSPDRDMSDESVVLAYATAVQGGSFEGFQRVGDWALFSCSMFRPISNQSIIEELAQKSFDACFRLTNNTWPVYEDLSLHLPEITLLLSNALKS